MLTQYRLTLRPEEKNNPRPEWAYRLYSALLELAPEDFSNLAHRDAITPVSQHLTTDANGILHWTINLLGNRSETALSGVLEDVEHFEMDRGKRISVLDRKRREVRDVDGLFLLAERGGSVHRLQICTAAAFKSQGRYLNLPSVRLIIQSLINKWNGCILDCPIEDEDGAGLEALVAGLRCSNFNIHDRVYYLKGNSIPGFVGSITLENQMVGFHRLLADSLLQFSAYSGIGIKTTLGMGGVERS